MIMLIKRLLQFFKAFWFSVSWHSLFPAFSPIISRLLKAKRRSFSIVAIFFLMIALQWSFPDWIAAQLETTSCSFDVSPTSVCHTSETPTDVLLAQSPTPLNEAKPTLLPKQRIAEQIARTPLEAPIRLINLFIVFFVTLGPIKIIPSFVQLTQNADHSLRQQLAFRSAALATIVILLVVVLGQNMVRVWQIRLPALLIAGGILLFLVALNLVMTQYNPPSQPQDVPPPSLKLVVTPLTFPTILPPFGIAIALVLMLISQEIGFNPLVVIGVLVLVMLLNLICMLAARPILGILKLITLQIFGFVLGVLQLALGIEWIISGLEIEALVFRRLFGS
jgi:multiple antibiotic resistance protein